MQQISVLGAGAWGTALAIHLAKAGNQVKLWSYKPEQVSQMCEQRENAFYLPGIKLPENLHLTSDLNEALQSEALLLVIPSNAFKPTLQKIKESANPPTHLAWATKGFEPEEQKLLHQVVEDELGKDFPMAVLSGPTFAIEVAKGKPTAMVSASQNLDEAQFWADTFHFDNFRVYTQQDIVGVEIGGAYKNILAIATGVSDGLELGANARAALISRGMAEMFRLAAHFKAQPETLMGLAGLGDLVLTATDNLSRNRRFGMILSQSGKTSAEVQQQIGQVVEGVKAVKVVKQLADMYGLDLPIMEQVYLLVTDKAQPAEAVANLMSRSLKSEAVH